jgi:hypothetical protein
MRRDLVPVVVLLVAGGAAGGCSTGSDPDLHCDAPRAQVLAAQSVPSAAYVPCISDIRDPWTLFETDSDQDRTVARLTWGSGDGSGQSATVTLLPACRPADGMALQSSANPGVVMTSETEGNVSRTLYEFAGGCVDVSVVRFPDAKVSRLSPSEFTVELVPRETLNNYVLDQTAGQVGLDPEPQP